MCAKQWIFILCDDICLVLGQIRTAIGQAQLLVNKKLKQFLGLCQDAEVWCMWMHDIWKTCLGMSVLICKVYFGYDDIIVYIFM